METEPARLEPHQQVLAATTGNVRVYSSASACTKPPYPYDVGGIRVAGTAGRHSVPCPEVPVATHVKAVIEGQHM